MRKCITIELRRLLRSPSLYIALLIGLAIAFSQIVQFVIPQAKLNEYKYFLEVDFLIPRGVFITIMGFAAEGWQGRAFLQTAPLLAAIPFANSYYIDIKNGYVKNLYTRIGKKEYLVSKYIVTFISGAVVVALPMLLNFWVSMMFVPYVQPITGTALYYIVEPTFAAELFYQNGALYVLLFCGINAVFGGIFACLGLVAIFFVENRFLVQLFPFILITGGTTVLRMSGVGKYFPARLMDIEQSTLNITGIEIMTTLGLLFIITCIYFWMGWKNDTI